jgi:apolipoprotein N-acyltransferase
MTRLTRKETLLSLLSGALAALSLPGLGLTPLAFVAWVPLFWVLQRRGGFLPGFLFGCTFFAIDLRWILTLSRFHSIVIVGYLLLAIYFAVGTGLLGLVLGWRRRSQILTWVVLAPAVFMLAEVLRTLGPFGMGFSTVYSSLYRVPWLIQSASVFGPWLITGLIIAANGSLLLLWRTRRLRYVGLAAACILVLAAFDWLPRSTEGTEVLQVAIVSSKVEQEVKLDARNLGALTARYRDLADEALHATPNLIVFPESILPAYILQDTSLRQMFSDLAQRSGSQVLLGTGFYADRKILNTVAWFRESGELAGTYAMVRPVPFGEYIPGRAILEWLGLGGWADSFLPLDLTRGDRYAPLGVYGTPICFESTFPSPSRRLTQAGAQVLITVTNDAWFNESSELAAHFSCAVFRAVENRRWVLQSANGGISGIVSPEGRIVASLNAEGVLEGQIALQSELSLYTRCGDWPLLVLAGVLALGVLLRRLYPRSTRAGENEEGQDR